MAAIPTGIVDTTLGQSLARLGWSVSRGKVRDTYANPSQPNSLHVVASDRISIFDFVLNAKVPQKGEVLTALTHFWLTTLFWPVRNQLLAVAPDAAFPPKRTLVVRNLEMQDAELIFRHHLGGSVWKQYEATGIVAGHTLPSGMHRWQKLSYPLFTPSTKAKVGHDVNITSRSYLEQYGEIGSMTVRWLEAIYSIAYRFASERGVLILDTKFEVGLPFVLADEILTPDSSRFTTVADWEQAIKEGRDPFFFDKQFVREWGAKMATPFGVVGIGNLNPENDDHLAYVHSLVVPDEILAETSRRYHQLFQMLTGRSLQQYQRESMHIS